MHIPLVVWSTMIFSIFFFQVSLALSGVMVVVLSVLGSAGFFSLVGVKSTLIILEVIPFLVLAVSVMHLMFLFSHVLGCTLYAS